ncbi:ubiquitin carboxyl-terminal hydrolase 15-like isoform X2 [Tubulanus polymorphus]|uniref:ubiquitin carboxyl-terminal hydrolase 15-like isoform X2 n=1 Tax=Tubulanus polymorphus TaxID=672921 RepID=UPI003DA26132
MAEGGPPDCDTQKNEIAAFLKTPLQKGDTWYLIDTKWYKQWKKYVGFDNWDTSLVGDKVVYPGPIDNSPLLKDGTSDLKDHLIDELDYLLVPTEGWNKLVTWYTVMEGQDPIARKVIEQGMFVKQCKVEVYLMDLKLVQNNELDKVQTQKFSRVDTIDDIEKAMRNLYSIGSDKDVRLWNKYMSNTYEHLNKPDNTLQDAGLYQGQTIVIEQKNDDGTWPRQTKRSTSSYNNYSGYGSSYYSSFDVSNTKSSSAPGLCGLSNLGNTCFMNSALQCLSNVTNLTSFFLSDHWKDELNYDNPLGMKGEIAKAYVELIRNMWSGKYSYTVPRNFKIAVGKFAPQFSGYQQQDSQELMAFLLDGLHEDLNRIKKKPYIEQKDHDGRPDEELAREAWFNYQKRNDSIIVDTFHGLLKSTLVCPECTKISVTFDPFCYLSLPLPIKKERQIEVFFMPLDPVKKPVQYKLTVPKMGTVRDLCKSLSAFTDVPQERMIVTDVYSHRFHKVFSIDDGLTHILERDDIFVYETPESDDDTNMIAVYLRERNVHQNSQRTYNHTTNSLFGTPLLVPVPRSNCTYEVLYNIILNKMSRYVKVPDNSDEWWREKDEKQTEDKQVNGDMELGQDGENDDDDMTGKKKSSDEEDDDSKDEEKNHRLFRFSLVNSYGSSELQPIKDDGSSLTFSNRSYIAVDWNMKAKTKFFDINAAEEFETHESVNMRPTQKKQVIQLNECLDMFVTMEKLGEHDPWYCPSCKKHQQATKKFDLWQLPNILVIHLKRFSYNRYLRDKLDTFVEFPVKGLNLKKLLINPNHGPALYDLLGVVNHYGGMGGGHYTAYAKNKDLNEWYYFDDSSVSQSSEDAVVTKAAYVLVYQRRDFIAQTNKTSSQIISAAASSNNANGEDELSNGNNGSCCAISEEDDMDIN